MIKEQLISFKTAKLAKKAGFNEDVYAGYNSEGELSDTHVTSLNYNKKWVDKADYYSAPTQFLLQKWLREEHGIYVGVEVPWYSNKGNIIIKEEEGFGWWVVKEGSYDESFPEETDFGTYEQALEKGLQEGLKLI